MRKPLRHNLATGASKLDAPLLVHLILTIFCTSVNTACVYVATCQLLTPHSAGADIIFCTSAFIRRVAGAENPSLSKRERERGMFPATNATEFLNSQK